jgi:chloramphenicol 3-O-phosphotransferase
VRRVPGRIVWLNGTLGAGKTTTATRLAKILAADCVTRIADYIAGTLVIPTRAASPDGCPATGVISPSVDSDELSPDRRWG